MRRRVPGGRRLALGCVLAGALLCAGVALAADQISGVVIPPAPSNNPVYSVTFGRDFTIRVEGAPQGQTWPCAVTVYLGNYWESVSPKPTPFPVDFVFPRDFKNQNLKLVVGTHNVTVRGQPESGKTNACTGEKRIQIEVKPQTSNVGPPPPPPIPKVPLPSAEIAPLPLTAPRAAACGGHLARDPGRRCP